MLEIPCWKDPTHCRRSSLPPGRVDHSGLWTTACVRMCEIAIANGLRLDLRYRQTCKTWDVYKGTRCLVDSLFFLQDFYGFFFNALTK